MSSATSGPLSTVARIIAEYRNATEIPHGCDDAIVDSPHVNYTTTGAPNTGYWFSLWDMGFGKKTTQEDAMRLCLWQLGELDDVLSSHPGLQSVLDCKDRVAAKKRVLDAQHAERMQAATARKAIRGSSWIGQKTPRGSERGSNFDDEDCCDVDDDGHQQLAAAPKPAPTATMTL